MRIKEQETRLTLRVHDDDDDNRNSINSVQLFIKLLFRYLEHLDSLELGYAKRLMSWVRL